MIISQMKIGDKLIFGKYGVTNYAIEPISWLKANRENDFISEYVLDYIAFDAMELRNSGYPKSVGNNDYDLSNIYQYMNSDDEEWYEPTHMYDAPPSSRNVLHYPAISYSEHCGFLHHFEDYEKDAIVSNIDLPMRQDFYGLGRLPLFNKKGIRGRPTEGLVCNRFGHGLSTNSFSETWLGDAEGRFGVVMDRSGNCTTLQPCHAAGLRPKCKLNGNLHVKKVPDKANEYVLVPFEAKGRPASNIATDDELLLFLGLR